jgi:hypothetical protein
MRLGVVFARRMQKKKAADFSAASFQSSAVAGLPARTGSKANSYATRPNADPDAWPVIIVPAIIVSAPFDVTFARRVVVRVLNDNAARTSIPPAASVLVTDHADVFDAVVWHNRHAICERSR